MNGQVRRIGLTVLIVPYLFNVIAQTDNNVFSKLRVTTSGNNIYYYDKSSPNTTYQKAFYIYVIKPNAAPPYLMVRFQYSGSSKINAYAYNITADKHNEFRVTPPDGQIIKVSDNNYNDFRSYCDLKVGPSFLNFLRELIKSENPKIEYLGMDDNVKVKITNNEINAVSNVLDAYDALLEK